MSHFSHMCSLKAGWSCAMLWIGGWMWEYVVLHVGYKGGVNCSQVHRHV